MVIESGFPPVVIQQRPFCDVLFESIERIVDLVALVEVSTERSVTFRELKQRSDQFGKALQQLGVTKGQRVLIALENSIESVIAFIGCISVGGVATGVAPESTTYELAQRISDCQPIACVCNSENVPRVKSANAESGDPVKIFITTTPTPGCFYLSSLLENDGRYTAPKIHPKADLAALPYSSGTTGRPKGVMLSHYNLQAAQKCYGDSAFHAPPCFKDRVLLSIPTYHAYGQTTLCYCVRKGATCHLMSRFTRQGFINAVAKYKINYVPLVPPQMQWLATDRTVDIKKLTSLEVVVFGGARCAKDIVMQFRQAYPNIKMISQTYGMTETTGVTLATIPTDDLISIAPESIGLPVANTVCKLVNPETHEEVEDGEPGELWIWCPSNMLGYWNSDEETRNTVDADGFLHTGDIVRVDETGFFYVVDRLKDVLKVNGYQVSPAEIEAVILQHPAVKDAAVIGDSNGKPVAFVVGEATRADLISFTNERLSPYKHIADVIAIDAIPRTPSGKAIKIGLRDRLKANLQSKI